MPLNTAIASGEVLLFGDGTHIMVGVAAEAQTASLTTGPPYDNNSGYLTVDFNGVFNVPVIAETLGSVSAGAAINLGDAIYASGGTYDPVSGITYGVTLCRDVLGAFVGISLAKMAAGTSATIPVQFKSAA